MKRTFTALTSTLFLFGAASAGEGQKELLQTKDGETTISEHAVSGQQLINAQLTRAVQPVAEIEDVVMDENGKIAYFAYETTQARNIDGEGFLPVTDLDLAPSENFGVDVSTANFDTEEGEQMRLSEAEQQKRMLTNILSDEVETADGTYNIRDVVFTPQGEAAYIIASQSRGGFVQTGDAIAVPFEDVSWDDGAWRTEASKTDLIVVSML